LKDILADADDYCAIFDNYVPRAEDEIDPAAHRELREAATARVRAEVRLAEAVEKARTGNMRWSSIGTILGTTGEAARQRYGKAKRTSA
jgi:hypothetical protein